MKTISFITQKGGTGKTSLCLGLGAKLVADGKRVLFIDADGQGNLSQVFYIDTEGVTLTQVLEGAAKIENAIIHTEDGDIIGANQTLSTYNGKLITLKESLSKVSKNYDYCLIDNSPSLGAVSISSLYASDLAIIPSQLDIYSFTALENTMATIKEIRKENKRVKMAVALNQYQKTNLSRAMEELLQDRCKQEGTGIQVLNTYIRTCNKIKESAFSGQPSIFKYSKNCNASKDFKALTEEIERML